MARRKLHVPDPTEELIYAGFSLGRRGLAPVGKPTREQWLECLHYLMHVERGAQFWIGDLLNFGEHQWGVTYIEVSEATGYNCATLRVFKWVAGEIPPSRRRDGLTFAHHREVAGVPPDEQDRILARAERDGWARKDVRREVERVGCERERPDGIPIVSGLHHGDSRMVVRALPNESVDLLLTDPRSGTGPAAARALDDVLASATTKLKPNSHIYVFTTLQWYPETADIVERHFELRQTLLWVRDGRHEQILFAHKGRRHLNGRRDGDVLCFDGVAAPQHPAEKPVALLEYLIEKSTQEKEMVLDPFMGTGSTCVAARNAGRRYTGIEIERRWYEHAQRRLDAAPR